MFDEQNKTRVELKTKIDISRSILSSLHRKTTDGFIYEPVAGETTAKGLPKLVPVDFNKLLSQMRHRITEIHVKAIGHGEVESKPTLSLLNVRFTNQRYIILEEECSFIAGNCFHKSPFVFVCYRRSKCV